jgi:hypothetical protein
MNGQEAVPIGRRRIRRLRSTVRSRTARLVTTALVAGTAVAITTTMAAHAAPSNQYVSGVTTPFNGVWLASGDGGHYWDASGDGLCRIDADATAPSGFTQNTATCDVQAKKPTQAVVGAKNADGTYYVYSADMSSKSGGPVRLTYDPSADSGKGLIVANSAQLLGGLNTVGFFADAGGNFKVSSVALGPCDHSPKSVIPANQSCLALYMAFERSKFIERINNVDQAPAQQSIEVISKTTDPRKGVRYGIATLHNADGTDDLYIDELGGNGVTEYTDIASCPPSQGSSDPSIINPPVDQTGGCAGQIIGAIATSVPQGIVVQNDAAGNGKYVYVADTPTTGGSTVLRYSPKTGLMDVVSSTVSPAYDSLLNPGQSVSTYSFILGLGMNPNTGDLFIGEDPTFAILANPPLNKGHLFIIPGGADKTPAVDCTATATTPCTIPPPPSVATPSLYAYGMTAPKGGAVIVPDDNDPAPGGHLWAADHSQGLCRFDVVKQAPALHAYNLDSCDDGSVLGSGGQTVYDDSLVPGSTTLHYLYVAQNDHLSPGVIRFTFDPSGDNGNGALVPGSAVIMAPNAGLNGDKANGLALGPCKPGAPASCKHSLYMGGLVDGFIRRINNPEDDPRLQTVDVVAMTTEQRAGTPGKGINGSMGMLGDDLYLPENQGFTVIKNVSQCPKAGQVCGTVPINVGQFGVIFGSAVGTDPLRNLVYAAISPGAANATVYQYDPTTNTSRIFATQGQMPAAGTAEATPYCALTCTRPVDPNNPPGGKAAFRFAQGLLTDANGNVYITEDALAGARGGRGHAWVANFIPYPPGATPVPLPVNDPVPTNHTCTVTLNVPSLASGQTWWVQFTSHGQAQINATWTIPVSQSAQLLLYPGNPFTGLADPVSTGSKGGSIASKNATASSFSISTAPTAEAAGTYTLQMFNASKSFGATTATVTFDNDANTACPTTPTAAHLIP